MISYISQFSFLPVLSLQTSSLKQTMFQSEGMSPLETGAESPSTLDSSSDYVPCATHTRLIQTGNRLKFSELESSVNSCRLCCLYKNIISHLIKGHLPSLIQPYSRADAEEKVLLESLTIFDDSEYYPDILHGFTLCITDQQYSVHIFRGENAEPDDDFTVEGFYFPSSCRIGRQTNSLTTFRHAHELLSNCLTNHACPKSSPGAVSLPKRLLEVRGSGDDPIRLIETRGSEHPYVCLSHCWGDPSHKQFKTTTRTVQGYMDKIRWHDLPATFQDAVTVCRSMEVQYLWIDSLCILQSFEGITTDELEATVQDFAQENSSMARTYQNSHFTISADLSTDMNSGIFSKLPIDDYEIKVTTDDGNSASLYIRQIIDHKEDKTPCLDTRGWTLQELILPPRVLHFGEFDIQWRCKSYLTCECGQFDREPHMSFPWHRFHEIEFATKPIRGDPEGVVGWWETVVRHYTSRKLTNPSDKLPALSGLAQFRKRVRGGVYLAGLWQDSLSHDLCWYHLPDPSYETPGLGRRPACYRAPSWSWASLDTDVCCRWWCFHPPGLFPMTPEIGQNQPCVILESTCELKTADPTGEVRSGFLEMEVTLIPGEICPNFDRKGMWEIHKFEASIDWGEFMPDCELEHDGLALGDRVFCAPLRHWVLSDAVRYGCLILKLLDTDLYRRVGFCTLTQKKMVLDPERYKTSQNSPVSDVDDYLLSHRARVRIRII
ncbi:heterokaryon incompatibility protein-domain-containing protein [Fusarium oxysporum]|nr:heterokaryon incompatibility protein-domain-containing protein [Fusarium oxysporum]